MNRPSRDSRLRKLLDEVDGATESVVAGIDQESGERPEVPTSGVFADRFGQIKGKRFGVRWSISSEVPPQPWESGTASHHAGGFDIFMGVDIQIRGLTNQAQIRKGLLIQAKRLSSLIRVKQERRNLKEQAVALLFVDTDAAWIAIYDLGEIRTVHAGLVLRILGADGGSRQEVRYLWSQGRNVRTMIAASIDCVAGSTDIPRWQDVVDKLAIAPRAAMTFRAFDERPDRNRL